MLSDDHLVQRLRLDAELQLRDVCLAMLKEHDGLNPFGMQNRQPIFFVRGVTCVGEPRVMKDKHYSILLRQGRAECRAVWWNAVDLPLPRQPWDVAFTIRRNEWNGNVSVQLEVSDVRSTA
jgi:single-stranded-DNA-specific exonuclease